MLLIRRIIGVNLAFGQIPRSYARSRRWICQSNILLNKIIENDESTEKVDEKDKNEKKTMNIEKVESPARIERKTISPIAFINQGSSKIPEDWRRNQLIPEWKRQKFALTEKFKGEKWNPAKKLSREQMDSVRLLKNAMPEMTTSQISAQFKISPEAVRRILKSKWKPSIEEEEDIFDRWKKRGERVKELQDEKGMPTQSKIILQSGNWKASRVKINKFKYTPEKELSPKDEEEKRKKKVQNKKKKFMKKSNKLEDMIF